MWRPTPPTAPKPRSWKLTPPVIVPIAKPWRVKWTRSAIDSGIGADTATLDAIWIPAADTGFGADHAGLAALALPVSDTGLGADRGLIAPQLHSTDVGLGADLARPGIRPADTGVGADVCQARPRYAAIDGAVGADMLTGLHARIGATGAGVGADVAASGFTAHAAALTSYTTPGTYQYRIPVWCRFIEIILCGSGRGGNGNSNALPGAGGNAGGWAAITLERGVDIPWTLLDITIVVTDGGAGGTGSVFVGGQGTNGSAVTAAISGTVILSAPGGTGERSGNQAGGSPGPYSYGGQTYPGGAETTTGSGTPGNPPGGGGRGGNGNTFGGFNGGKGAPGVGHVRARQ